MANSNEATIMDVKNYFGYSNAAEFRQEWSKLTDQDRKDLKIGIGKGETGPLTY
jgi:hypothetical protein